MKRRLEESTSSLPPTRFPRRPGTDDLGRDYEVKISALLALRCVAMKDTEDMWIGSNVDQVGDFDDVVVYRQDNEGNCTAYMMQLKHQENPKNLAPHQFTYSGKDKAGQKKKSREDFSLPKYSAGFLELKERLANPAEDEFEVLEQLRNAVLVFIIFTNKGVNSCEFLEIVSDAALGFLDTSGSGGNVFKFDPNLNYDPHFLQQLLLFTNQVHVNEVDDLIKNEIKQLMGSSNLANVDLNAVTYKFVSFIKSWVKDSGTDAEKGSFKIFDTLTKSDVINKLTDLILDLYNLNLSKELYSFYYCQQKFIWNEIVSQKSLTIVDADDSVSTFLKQYVGSVIRCYCNRAVKTWGEDLPKKTASLFYKEHVAFKPQMLKIVAGRQNMTMMDIYKCLWFERKLPLLLEISNKDDIRSIRKVLKLSNYGLRVVVINEVLDPNVSDIPGHFVALQNLTNEHRAKILNQAVNLQGRPSTALGSLVDKSMYEYVKCRDIIHILLNDFSIGNDYEPLTENFIPRSLSKVLFDSKALRQVKNDTFLIYNLGEVRDFLCGNKNVVFAEKETAERIEALKRGGVVHQLRFFKDRYFEWEQSFGSTRNLRQHQIINPQSMYRIFETEALAWDLPQNVDCFWNELGDVVGDLNTHLINANPGMGKSVLLDFIACRAPANAWVLKINLNEHYKYYDKLKRRNRKAVEHLNHFKDQLLGKYDCTNVKLAEAVFQKLLGRKKILVLMDGFDEISISYKDEVTEIARCLHTEGYAVWLTTRPVMKSHLEEALDLMSTTLKPFRIADQKQFLTTYFAGHTSSVASESRQEIIEGFAEQLLQAVRVNLTDRDHEFTGIPLQTKLLADVFKNDCKASLSTSVITFNEKFDILFLYEEFLGEKNNILCEKFGVGVKDMHIFFEKHQQLFALQTLFWAHHFRNPDIDEQLSEYYEDKQHKIQFLQREGVVVVEQQNTGTIQRFNISFVHRTFAEFLAAQWLAQNFDAEDEATKETVQFLLRNRFTEHNTFLYNVFDRIVVRDCPLHLAVINGKLDEAKQIIKADPDSVNAPDAFGRSILHIIALYGARHLESEYYPSGIEDLIYILDEIPGHKIINLKDRGLGYGPLDYAVANRSLGVANKMCEKSLELSMEADTAPKDNIFTHCADLEYKALFKVLLQFYARSDLLLNEVDEDTTIESYCELDTPTNTARLCNYADEFGTTTLLELFRTKTPTGSYYYKDLCFACVFGTEDNVLMLLAEGADVNKLDNNHNSPLHYSVIHVRLKVVKILLASAGVDVDVDVDIPGNEGNSALHCATQHGCDDIIVELLLKGANINQQNHDGDTPLNVALIYNDDMVQLLISKGADGSVQNNDGKNALHYAVAAGLPDVVSELLSNATGELLNAQDDYDQTPLHCLLRIHHKTRDLEERKEILRLLLGKAADVNKQDVGEDTPLHHASREYAKCNDQFSSLRKFYKFVAVSLLDQGASVDVKNMNGKTPLDEAAEDEGSELVPLLRHKLRTLASELLARVHHFTLQTSKYSNEVASNSFNNKNKTWITFTTSQSIEKQVKQEFLDKWRSRFLNRNDWIWQELKILYHF